MNVGGIYTYLSVYITERNRKNLYRKNECHIHNLLKNILKRIARNKKMARFYFRYYF